MVKSQNAKKLCRIYLCIMLLAFSCFGGLSGCGVQSESAEPGETTDKPGISVTFFDVGKGDAILVETKNHCMLIDSGFDDTAETILDYLERENIDRLDYMLITHFDKDHVGGADHILEAVEVGEVLQPDYESDAKQYREYMDTMEKMQISPRPVTETLCLSLDEAELLVYPPQRRDYKEEDNDFSLVVSMHCGEKAFSLPVTAKKNAWKNSSTNRSSPSPTTYSKSPTMEGRKKFKRIPSGRHARNRHYHLFQRKSPRPGNPSTAEPARNKNLPIHRRNHYTIL